jgi:hypothetical protein
MRLLTLKEAQESPDLDVRMIAGRASRYRVFGSKERIPDDELFVADLRDSIEPPDFASSFKVLDRHPLSALMLVRGPG